MSTYWIESINIWFQVALTRCKYSWTKQNRKSQNSNSKGAQRVQDIITINMFLFNKGV